MGKFAIDCKGGKTKQDKKNECNINTILAKARKNGMLPYSQRVPHFGDYSDPKTFHEAQNTVLRAQLQFAGLPANVRDTFNNNPADFLEFATNPDNNAEMVKMGLLPAVTPAKTVDTPVTPSNDDDKIK